MGQLFIVMTKDEAGKTTMYDGETQESMKEYQEYLSKLPAEEIEDDYDEDEDEEGYAGGYKLLEYAFWGNAFLDKLCRKLLNNPTQVAFVGAYAMEYAISDASLIPNNLSLDEVAEMYRMVWTNEDGKITIEDIPALTLNEEPGCFLVNHTKKTFIDCVEYRKQFGNDNKGVHPLPLLTAIGNDLGAFGFEGKDLDKVGSWAYDTISFETEIPEGYKEEKYYFAF